MLMFFFPYKGAHPDIDLGKDMKVSNKLKSTSLGVKVQ